MLKHLIVRISSFILKFFLVIIKKSLVVAFVDLRQYLSLSMYVSHRYDQKPDDTSLSEAALWEEFRRGDKASFACLYTTYYPVLFRYAKTMCQDKNLIQDCIQELFAELIKSKSSLSPTTSVKFYLYRSFKRKLIKKIAKESRTEALTEKIFDYQDEPIFMSEEFRLIEAETIEEKKGELLRALNSLTKKQKKAVQLKFYENLSYLEIASGMSISVDSVYNLLSKAMRRMRQHIRKIYGMVIVFIQVLLAL
jgi:RNA polymerase sigma factor (sigma-70 family)